jgi:hypothetical protein
MRTSHFLVARVLAGSFAGGCGSDDDTSDALSAVCESEEQVLEDLQSDLEGLDDVPLAELSEDVGQAVQQSIQDLLQQYQTAYENSSCNS